MERMRQPSFALTTLTVAVLVLFGLAVKSIQPLVPEIATNRLESESSQFLRQASKQPIDWYPLGPEPFARARRLDKPVMLVVGAPWSTIGRIADKHVFEDVDVGTALARNFVCVRVDGQLNPQWLGAFLPLTRPEWQLLDGFQIWFLDPQGRMFSAVRGFGKTVSTDPASFVLALDEVLSEYRQIRLNDRAAQVPGDAQQRDIRRIVESDSPEPFDGGGFAESLRTLLDREHGGFTAFNRTQPYPAALRYFLEAGELNTFQEAADLLLRGPLVDWLDGGFFAAIRYRGKPILEFDKVATTNADLMLTFAQAGEMFDDERYRFVARRTFEALSNDFVLNGRIAACRVGDEDERDRSARSSFSPRRLRELLSEPSDRDWARDRLGLRVETNPMMVIRVDDVAALIREGEQWERVSDLLRKGSAKPSLAISGTAFVDGYVASRMVRTARLFGDEASMRAASLRVDRLSVYVANDDIRHSDDPSSTSEPYLGDYLAVADAYFQDYCATGHIPSLRTSVRILDRALTLFAGPAPGVWKGLFRDPDALGVADVNVPEVLDLKSDSSTAQMMSLASRLGRILIDLDSRSSESAPLAARFNQAALSTAQRVRGLVPRLVLFGSAAVGGLVSEFDQPTAVCVGPDSVAAANELAKKAPNRLVVPALDLVRPDLQKRSAGCYVVRGGEVRGPFSVDEAARLLSAR